MLERYAGIATRARSVPAARCCCSGSAGSVSPAVSKISKSQAYSHEMLHTLCNRLLCRCLRKCQYWSFGLLLVRDERCEVVRSG